MTTNNGVLLVDKARGPTSHDVVARIRRLLAERRVGHAGTLDPMATGLLIVAVGPATRLLRYAQGQSKRYEGEVTFGVRTDSLDADGAVVEIREVPPLDGERVAEATRDVGGRTSQTPPMVSALKVKGRRLHEMARAGEHVERSPRPVVVSNFELTATDDPARWRFVVTCSSGTYVRVLLSDVAERLGTIGHLSSLRRTHSGRHDVSNAVTLEGLEQRVAAGAGVLAPARTLVDHLAPWRVDGEDELRIRRGQRVTGAPISLEGEVAALNGAGELVAVLVRRDDSWQPTIVMPPSEMDE